MAVMIRTQVQLTDDQLKALRQISAATGKSMAELVRDGVDLYLSGKQAVQLEDRIERAIRVAGMFSSGITDVSTHHDRYLAQAFGR